MFAARGCPDGIYLGAGVRFSMNIRPRQHELPPLAFDDAHRPHDPAVLQPAGGLQQATFSKPTPGSVWAPRGIKRSPPWPSTGDSMRTYAAVVERDPDTGFFVGLCRVRRDSDGFGLKPSE